MSMIAGLAPLSPSQLDALRADPDGAGALCYPEDATAHARNIDLDKAWHGIHFLLTSQAWDKGDGPQGLAILGGEDIGDDQGYGPARVVTPPQVAAVAAALSTLTDEELARRYDPQAMDDQQIYPTIWTRDGDEGLAYLLHHFHALERFYAEAAARGDAVLQWIM